MGGITAPPSGAPLYSRFIKPVNSILQIYLILEVEMVEFFDG